MTKSLYTILLLGLIIAVSSCRNDFEFSPSTGNLEFSKDTVYLDTVFTNIGSSTYNLKVYNRSDDDIVIPNVRLGEGDNSFYRLNIDGRAGKTFEDVEILAKDSIFIFVETTLDIQDFSATALEFLYEDKILFDDGSRQQDVDLVTLVKDAVFLFPERDAMTGEVETLLLGTDGEGNEIRIEGFFLEDSELTFTNEKPYVIYGYAAVGANKTLTVEAGARVHFHRDSGLIVGDQGTLIVDGALSTDQELLENEVIFEGDRLEPTFANVPGQWGTIWLTDGSTGNQINHATIRNGTVGILMDNNDGTTNPTLTIANSQIHNNSNVGLLARTGSIDAENLVVGSAGQISLYCNIGGSYNFRHCTFANYWRNSFRNLPAVLIDNYVELADGTNFTGDLQEANFSNCIIYGSNNIELILDPVPEAIFNYSFTNCLIRFNDINNFFADNPLYNFENEALFSGEILNMDPNFLNTELAQFNIGEESAANGQGDAATSALVPLDIIGTTRGTPSDIGAYESIIFEDGN